MGNFLSIRIEIPGANAVWPSSLFYPKLASRFFTPVALGGLETRNECNNWYLAGYALENYISGFVERGVSKPASIHRFASADNEVYIESIASALISNTSLSSLKSPFEEDVGDVTFIRGVHLNSTVSSDADNWLAKHPKASISLFGTVDLAERSHAFRFRFNGDERYFGAPFLSIRTGLSPFINDLTEMLIFSQSTVWLQSDQGELADINLSNLSVFVNSIISLHPSSSATLRIDGSIFEKERSRIEVALGNIFASEEKW